MTRGQREIQERANFKHSQKTSGTASKTQFLSKIVQPPAYMPRKDFEKLESLGDFCWVPWNIDSYLQRAKKIVL